MAIEAASRTIGAALNDLFQHLGIDRAHLAAGRLVLTDWLGLATLHPERVGSLTLVSPQPMDAAVLQALGSRLLVVTGDQGPPAENVRRLLTRLPQAATYTLRDYTSLPWSDVMAERVAEIAPVMTDFLDRVGQGEPIAPVSLLEQQGEAAGISYHIRGAGPPLVLMPLDLTPSQWEPLIPVISARYCTITLGGPMLGPVSPARRPGALELPERRARAAGCRSDPARRGNPRGRPRLRSRVARTRAPHRRCQPDRRRGHQPVPAAGGGGPGAARGAG